MLSLVILFVFILATLFIAFLKKPLITLLTAITGLLTTGLTIAFPSDFSRNFLSAYQGVSFNASEGLYALIAIFFTILLILIGYRAFQKRLEYTGDYIGLLLFSLFGALVMLSFTDLFLFFLGLEIMSIPIYVMAGANKRSARSSEASIKYFITGSFATGILLFGIALIYGDSGTFRIDELRHFFSTQEATPLAHIGLLFILAAFLFKIGAAPFHFWSPDVYDGAPSVVTGFMATIVKIGAFGAFAKLFTTVFVNLYDFWMPILIILSILTMFVGNLSALGQIRFKRLLAYSSISHVGYALITIAVVSPHSFMNLWYYLFSYGFSTIALITVQMIVNDRQDRIEAFRGLARSNPFIGFVAVVALLSLAGIPPLMGFFGKYLIFMDAIGRNPGLIIVALVNAGIGIYYYLRTIIIVLQKPDESPSVGHVQKLNPTAVQLGVLAICVLMLLFGGLFLL